MTPILARLLCDKIVRCFGFRDIKSDDAANIMAAVVFRNLWYFMAQSIGQDFWNWTVWATTSWLLIPLPPLLKIWPAARMLIKCACDFIIILHRVFCSEGINATPSHIRTALIEYSSRKDAEGHSTESTRTKVHREIEENFPVKKKFYRNLKREKAEEWMEEIIKRNELRPRDYQSPLNLETQPRPSEEEPLFITEGNVFTRIVQNSDARSGPASKLSDSSSPISSRPSTDCE